MKKYPFSLKDAHDIEFYKNRLFNILHDLEVTGQAHTEYYKAIFERREEVIGVLLACLDSRRGNVAWLTGKQFGLAKFCVAWANEERARVNNK